MMGGIGGGGQYTRSSQVGDIDQDSTKIYDSSVSTRLATYIRPLKAKMLLSITGVILYTAATVSIPLLIKQAADEEILDENAYALNVVGGIFGIV